MFNERNTIFALWLSKVIVFWWLFALTKGKLIYVCGLRCVTRPGQARPDFNECFTGTKVRKQCSGHFCAWQLVIGLALFNPGSKSGHSYYGIKTVKAADYEPPWDTKFYTVRCPPPRYDLLKGLICYGGTTPECRGCIDD